MQFVKEYNKDKGEFDRFIMHTRIDINDKCINVWSFW